MSQLHARQQVAAVARRIPASWVRAVIYIALPCAALAAPSGWEVGLWGVVMLAVCVAAARDPATHRPVLLAVAALTACDLSPLTVSGSVVRLYHIAAPLVLVVAVAHRRQLVGGLRQLSRSAVLTVLVVALVAVLSAASLLWTISVRDTMVSTLGQLSATGLLVLYAGAVRAGLLPAREVLVALWASATVGSLVACVEFTATVLTPARWAAAAGASGVPWPRPDGLMTEGVWAALVAATGLACSAAVRRELPRLTAASWALNGAVVVLVASRAVILGAAVGLAVCVIVVWRRLVSTRSALVLAAAGAAVVVLTVSFAPGFAARFDPRLVVGLSSGADGGSANSRAAVYRLVSDELPGHLPLGAGAGSLNKLTSDPAMRQKYIDGGELNSGRGTTNVFLGYTFDFGYLGVVLVLALTLLVALLAYRASARDRGLSVFLATLYLVDFQFNNGLRFGFVHVLLAALLASDGRRPAAGSQRVMERVAGGPRPADVRTAPARRPR